MARWQRTEKGKHDLSRRHRCSTEMALVCTQLNIVSLLIIAARPHSTDEGRCAKIPILLEKYLTCKIPFPVHIATKSQALPKDHFCKMRHVCSSLYAKSAKPRHKYVRKGIRCPTSSENAYSVEQYLEVRATALLAPWSREFLKTSSSERQALYTKHCQKLGKNCSNLLQLATFLARNKTRRPWHIGRQILRHKALVRDMFRRFKDCTLLKIAR